MRTAEVIVTSFLFLSPVWSRPAEVVCDGGRKEGDKWFDGCQWCICQQSGPVCSLSECSFLSAQLPPCHNVGSSWTDGCYMCKCHESGIECTVDQACILLMRSERYRRNFQSHSACVEPKDDRCICGVDAVPSCTAEVIDKDAYPAITIELIPSLSSPNVISRINSGSHVNYENDNNMQEDRSEHKNQLNQNKEHSLELYRKDQTQNSELSHTVDPHIFARLQNNKKSWTYSAVTGDTERTKSSRRTEPYSSRIPYAREARKNMDVVRTRLHPGNHEDKSGVNSPYVIPTENRYPDRGTLENRMNGLIREPFENVQASQFESGHHGSSSESLRQIQAYSQDLDAASDSVSPSFLVVSANRCRWGARWYGGSLRCYCGEDNSITCGEPSFVATRIDGFRLQKTACEEGHTWEDKNSCTMCECQISGVALCRRSPSCLLPFLIKPLSKEDDDLKNFEISGGNQFPDRQREFTGTQEQTFFWNKAKDETDGRLSSDEKQNLEHFNSENTKSDNISGEMEIPDMDTGIVDEKESNFTVDDEDGSGEIKLFSTTTSWFDEQDGVGQISRTADPRIGRTSQKNSLNGSGKSIKDNQQNNNGGHTTQNSYSSDSHRNKDNDRKESDIKETTQVTTIQCKPKSRWIDGCRRCQCSTDGQKYCDESRCPQVVTSLMETAKPSSSQEDVQRPVQRPPSGYSPVRDHPVHPLKSSSTSCGRFLPGDMYWDDCNACLCEEQGPKCTAKNCT